MVASVLTNTDLPFAPVPYRKNSACSLRRAGQRVADHPLQVGLQLGVAARDLVEELPPVGQSPPGVAVVILVIRSARSCGRCGRS
jgi:hypothetical protein